jgi:phosphoribosylanthranilate isomerase
MSKPLVKICGIKTRDALEAAVNNGASYIGLNFYRPSPRYAHPDLAAQLAKMVPGKVKIVALMVEPEDRVLDDIFERFTPDFLQLHGKETPQRVAEIKAARGVPVIKALPISEAADFEVAKTYEAVADYLMFDGKAPEGAMLPGGNAISFDWKLLGGRKFARPWFLAGGINARNIKEAIDLSGAKYVDIASGVETAPGEKDPAKIKELLNLFA